MESLPASTKSKTRYGILLVSNLFSVGNTYGGVGRELATRLSESGWQVTTTSAQHNRLLRPVDMLVAAWHARHHYLLAQVDLFSGPAFIWAEAVCWLLRQLRKPYVLTLHGGNLPAFAQRRSQRARRLLDSAAAVTSPSRYLCDQMSIYRSDIVLLPNPLELDNYLFVERLNPQPSVVWLRAFSSGYNPSLAASVVALLKRDFPEIHLLMIGPDKGDGSFQSFQLSVKSLGIETQVYCPGAVAKRDVPSWLNKGDIFLNTTNVDNTPVSVMEAMACGLCIVSTNVGGIPYLLEHEQDALLVPPDDPDAMAAAVRRILTEPDLARRLSYNARRKAEQYDWETILPKWEMLFVEVLEGRHESRA